MSTSITMMMPLTTELTHSQFLSEDLAHEIHQALRYVLLPCASVLGIVGNVTSIVILSRQGFKKCSNVLLMALSVSDVLFLTGMNNISNYIYFENTPLGFRFSETINYVLYIVFIAFYCLYTTGLLSALIIPALITFERVLAIFSPLKVYFILTPRRTLIVVSCLYILTGAYFLYRNIICMQLKQLVVEGFTVGIFLYTDVYVNDVKSGLYGLIESIVNYMTGIIPISIVTLGCVVIGIQVAVITSRRKQLTGRQVKLGANTSPSKTTKTLLSICVVYIVCSGFAFVLGYVAEVRSVKQDIGLGKVLGSIQDLLLCVNCVGDFVIYIHANNRYKKSSNQTEKSTRAVLKKRHTESTLINVS